MKYEQIQTRICKERIAKCCTTALGFPLAVMVLRYAEKNTVYDKKMWVEQSKSD